MFGIRKLLRFLAEKEVCGSCRRYAGHSKWANIRHIKAQKDGEKSDNFNKLTRLIRFAIQEGKSSDPDVNVRLAQAIEQAKRAQMPAQTIKNALKHGEDNKTVDVLWTLELKGPGGCAIVVSLNTDNFSRSKQDINATIRKSNIGVAPGSVSHLFTCKGVIQTQPLQNATFDDTLNDAICMNVEEVEEINEDEEKYLQFTCDALHLKGVTKQLEEKNYIVMSAEIEYLPKTLIVLNSEVLKNVRNFYQRLENNPHVVNIFDNITWED